MVPGITFIPNGPHEIQWSCLPHSPIPMPTKAPLPTLDHLPDQKGHYPWHTKQGVYHTSHIWCHCTVKKQWITSSPHFFTNEAPCHYIYDINSHNNVLLAIGNFSCCWYAFILDWFQCFICTEFVQYICLYWCDHMTKWYSMYIIWEAWQFVKRWQMRSFLSFMAEND